MLIAAAAPCLKSVAGRDPTSSPLFDWLQSGMPRNLLRLTRTVHLYVGAFITPALLFFAFTGALQTFSLHETTRGSSYKPPSWAVVLGQIHKKQTSIVPVRRPPPPGGEKSAGEKPAGSSALSSKPADRAAPGTAPEPKSHPLPLKIFFLIVAVGLFTSTLSGVYMSYKYAGNKSLITALLIAGAILPVILVFV